MSRIYYCINKETAQFFLRDNKGKFSIAQIEFVLKEMEKGESYWNSNGIWEGFKELSYQLSHNPQGKFIYDVVIKTFGEDTKIMDPAANITKIDINKENEKISS